MNRSARTPPPLVDAPHRPRFVWLVAKLMFTVAAWNGCRPNEKTRESALASATSPLPSSPPSSETPPPRANQHVALALGEFRAGTIPGTFDRIPEIEPAQFSITLGPFQMDRLPYPNDPERPPLLTDSAEKASRLCSEAQGRLCTELEWERACKGPHGKPFSTGERWTCERPMGCPSEEGIIGLGSFPEWTSSLYGAGSPRAGKNVVRGLSRTESIERRHCAARSLPAKEAAFRCCYGAPNGSKVPEPTRKFIYEKTSLTTEQLGKLLEKHPETHGLSRELVLFREPDAARTVIDRGPGDKMGFQFTVAPLLWSPVPGSLFLAVTGRSGRDTSFVVLYHVVDGGDHRLASSFVMHDEVGPVAFAYSAGLEPRFHFSTCWGCPGETGKILYRGPDYAVILQP